MDDKNPNNKVHRREVYKLYEDYKDRGKICSIGVSNFERHHIEELWNIAKHRPTVNQCEFHPHLTRKELRAYCQEKGIFFQAHTSLATLPKSLCNNQVVKEISDKHNIPIPQLLLAFAYCQKVGVIPKSSNPERVESNMQMVDVKLTKEEVEKLNMLNQDYPYSPCSGWNVL